MASSDLIRQTRPQALLGVRSVTTAVSQGSVPQAPARATAAWRLKLLLLGGVLALYLASRWHTAVTMPLEQRHLYAESYGVSLALLCGAGYSLPEFTEAAEAAPIRKFLRLERAKITQKEFAAFRDAGPSFECADGFEGSRVLDVRLAALLWSMFGIRWHVLFLFYAVMGAVACGLMFCIGRTLGGGYWAGLLVALLYMISPLENFSTSWSIRDSSPLYVTVLSFFLFICVVERFRSAWINLAALAVLGAATMLGIGWRFDALLLPPFFLAAAAVLLLSARRGWRYTASAAAAFLLGAFATLHGIRALGPPNTQPPGTGFHIAYYGDFSRAELMNLENTFQTSFSDERTYRTAADYHRRLQPDRPPLEYLDSEHAGVCRRMFLEMAQHHSYDWLRWFPSIYCRLLNGIDQNPGMVQGIHLTALAQPPWLALLYELGAERLLAWLPCFALLGFVVVPLYSPEPVRAAAVIGYSVYYAAALFAVFPVAKHLSPLVAPLSIVGGCSIAFLLGGVMMWIKPTLVSLPADGRTVYAVAFGRSNGPWRRPSRRRVRWVFATIAVTAAIWLAALWPAYSNAVSLREECMADLLRRREGGTDVSHLLRGPQSFCSKIDLSQGRLNTGYLMTIQGGDGPARLSCDLQMDASGPSTTVHRIHRQRTQYFVVCCMNPSKPDAEKYVCTVDLEGDASILSCTAIDLSEWKRLPMSTVFYEGQRSPGSPVAHRK